LSAASITARPFFDPGSEELRFLPEGPRRLQNHPSGSRSLLGWVAIQHAADEERGSLNVLHLASGSNESHPLPGRPGFFVETDRPGLWLVGMERRLVLYNIASGQLTETGLTLPEDPRVIINDGLAVEGGVFFGTKHLEFNQPVAALYFFDADAGKLREVAPGQMCSNGKMLLRDAGGPSLIDIDTIPKTITRYRLGANLHTVLDRSPVVAPEALPLLPDGLRPSPQSDSFVVAYYNPAPAAAGLAQELSLADGGTRREWLLPGSSIGTAASNCSSPPPSKA
jgi:hypothetical protein